MNVRVTIFESVFSRSGIQSTLLEELGKVINGYWRVQIEHCRSQLKLQDVSGYKEAKLRLPAVTFCASFEGGHKIDNLVEYNSVLVIDIDHISEQNISELKKRLGADPYVYALWLSPSGLGLKGLVKLSSSSEFHKLAFDQVALYFELNYGVSLDKSGSDITRLCYVSWDDELIVNEDASSFILDLTVFLLSPLKGGVKEKNVVPEKVFRQVLASQKSLYFKTEGRNSRSDRDLIQRIIKFLTKKQLSITSSNSDWLRVGMAIANSFTFDIGEGYFLKLCRLDGIYHDEYKSKCLIDYCYRNRRLDGPNMATIVFLSRQLGFERSSIA